MGVGLKTGGDGADVYETWSTSLIESLQLSAKQVIN
jgi:hypothetical protein